jgi:hypothetical protein
MNNYVCTKQENVDFPIKEEMYDMHKVIKVEKGICVQKTSNVQKLIINLPMT